MVLRFNDVNGADALGWLGEWFFPARGFFMRSSAYETLRREMRGYVRGDIHGRSFLIAAHRGVGKTSLALRVVDDLERDLIVEAVSAYKRGVAPPGVRTTTWQRPLLVKLHASSLIASTKKPPDWPELLGSPPGETSEDGAEEAEGGKKKPMETPSAEAALQQITIALYRAFASEVAASFALHARDLAYRASADRPAGRGLLELAGQLTLDLDVAPDISALRTYWDRLGRLACGVLWPGEVGMALSSGGLSDLGLREVVALVTANQAFQVCSGRVEASQTTKGAAQREASVQASAKLDAKDAVNKLWALAAGGLVGGAVLSDGGGGAAAAAGLGAALLSALTLGLSAARSQRSERTAEYSFIADRSIQTLDRDLPAVIARVRAAGLAPVFLIDELDKLETPGESIKAIITRLKNLTTDYGFFCFLTDRGYYDEIERKLHEEVYPSEHTFFSHRLLLLYRPAELARHVRAMWSFDTVAETARFDPQAAWIITCLILHRARLNATDVRREEARLCREDGALRPDASDICGRGQYLVPMAIQLAIEHVLRHDDIRRRVEDDDAFAQLAIEVLYRISREWESGEREVDVGLEAVRQDLITRRRLDGDAAAQKAALEKTVSEDDLVTLATKVQKLAAVLKSFAGLRSSLLLEADFRALPTDPVPLPPFATIHNSELAKIGTLAPLLLSMPGTSPGLVAADAPRPYVFRFRFDRYGVERFDGTPEAQLQRMHDGIAFLDGFTDALSGARLTLPDLFEAGILPANLAPSRLQDSAARLWGFDDPAHMAEVADDAALMAGLASSFQPINTSIVAMIGLALAVRSQAKLIGSSEPTARDAFQAIDRMLGVAPLVAAISAGPTSLWASLKSPSSVLVGQVRECPIVVGTLDRDGWAQLIGQEWDRLCRIETNLRPPKPDANQPNAWRERIMLWFAQRAVGVPAEPQPSIEFWDLAGAAAGLVLPSNLRPDVHMMSVAEWSRFCMLMIQGERRKLYPWALGAGLHALGFGPAVLQTVGGPGVFIGDPGDRPFVLLTSPDDPAFDAPPDVTAGPAFAVPKADRRAYVPIVRWLRSLCDMVGQSEEE